MQRLQVGLVAAVLVAAWAAPGAADDAKVERGKQVYADQKCKLCHSVAGAGNPKGSLDGAGTKLKRDEIKEWLLNPAAMSEKAKATRKPAMKACKGLSAEDLDALVSYVESLKAK